MLNILCTCEKQNTDCINTTSKQYSFYFQDVVWREIQSNEKNRLVSNEEVNSKRPANFSNSSWTKLNDKNKKIISKKTKKGKRFSFCFFFRCSTTHAWFRIVIVWSHIVFPFSCSITTERVFFCISFKPNKNHQPVFKKTFQVFGSRCSQIINDCAKNSSLSKQTFLNLQFVYKRDK